MNWIMNHWSEVVLTALTVIGGASVAVKAIAPLTESKLDDRLAGALTWLHAVLSKLAMK